MRETRPDPADSGVQEVASRIEKSGGYGFIYSTKHPELNTYQSAGNYGNYGAAVGGVVGGYVGNQYANQ